MMVGGGGAHNAGRGDLVSCRWALVFHRHGVWVVSQAAQHVLSVITDELELGRDRLGLVMCSIDLRAVLEHPAVRALDADLVRAVVLRYNQAVRPPT